MNRTKLIVTLLAAATAATASFVSVAHAGNEIEFPPEKMTRPDPVEKTDDAKPADADADDNPLPAPKQVATQEEAAAVAPNGNVTVEAPTPRHKADERWIEPYGAIAGGMHLQSLHQAPDATTQAQNPTVAVSRLGVRGGVGEHVTFASELEASLGGPQGYGGSVWEGQAALAIRDQYVRYSNHGFSFAAGRIADPASFDYVSAHTGDLLYADLYTRDPLLYSGADRGNGLFGSYQLDKYFTVAAAFHSTNPTGITGTLEIGGKLQPFDRPFYLAAAQVGNSQNNLPDQNLHIYFGSPSIQFKSELVEAKFEVQMYSLDAQTSQNDDQTIRGYNFRGGVRGRLPTAIGRVSPFFNASRNKNEILDPTDSKYRLADLFRSYTVSMGADLDIWKKSGIGASYAMVDTKEPDQHVRQHYLNVGATYWIENSFAIGVRASVFAQQISGEMMTTGSRSLFMTARMVLD
ncbi:MAG TPA: hypothetical protein VGM90_05905 [Kofleriaceae bacterium]|jgi:hypothetical protein